MSYDPAIVEDYEASIKELTFNSRPIIETLTTIAQENTDAAEGILNVITSRIYKCIPEQKLFAMYLLDSICKIVGQPYNLIVGPEIFKLFSHVYVLVSDSTRGKLVKMYELWKVTRTKNAGGPLFPPEELEKIGKFLQQAGYRKPETPAVSASDLIADIDMLLPIMKNKLVNNPRDTSLNDRFNALSELKLLLQSQALKQNDLLGIKEKLSSMKQAEVYAASSTPKVAESPVLPKQVPGPFVPEPGMPGKAEALFADLLASGLVKMEQSLKAGSKPVYDLVMPKEKYEPSTGNDGMSTSALEQLLMDANNPGRSAYEQAEFKELLKISKKLRKDESFGKSLQSFVNHNKLDVSTISLLYDAKASKCAQCGKRFTDDEAGNKRKRIHLDWHFRINKKSANYKTNIQSRNWYLDDLEWVKFNDEDLLEFGESESSKEASKQPEQKEEERVYVIIPAHENITNNVCTICREQIKPTYDEQLGEWIWDGCVYAAGGKASRKIVHASCWRETAKKRSSNGSEDRKVKRERV
ncbi:hypothetical protein FT663_00066 [Candidozyma haemuli var. vulneris]|uniref:CID domain-containing protein n=1 Tax=Candidozyma haemuli TaxID=45357 RepID=A0A2V1AUS7_9ASCO|nr:hypothetical protein CXQ85_000855 [[Candida] haemuloni]KAF3994046.1 hypothetical protein FT662_00232 [[Candida] haemuloni var. vulneris]KAF3995843.1 hypothetical protein FT663_00066 [[Candida] haemuloni var. vulneris]PVH21860.1 hypothetical protein CXQ85_000855 [[Candida] haemuloni]